MRQLLSLVVLELLITTGAMASVFTTTTPLYDNSSGSTQCVEGPTTNCTFQNSWDNAARIVTQYANAGSFDGTNWVSAGQSNQTVFNWGVSSGSYWYNQNSGGSMSYADIWSMYLTDWTDVFLNTNGFMSASIGNSEQLVYTILYTLSLWSCNGNNCINETWWSQIQMSTTESSGTTTISQFGSNQQQYPWRNFSMDKVLSSGHSIFNYNRDGTPSVPEPSTYAMFTLGGGLAGVGIYRRRRKIA